MKVLFELRPALDGFAGIPQETRLLFRGLSSLPGVTADGLIQSSNRVLARGLPDSSRTGRWSEDRRVDRLARVVVSMQGEDPIGPLKDLRKRIGRSWAVTRMLTRSLLGATQPLTHFTGARFEDFLWRALFAKTLPHDDFGVVTSAHYRLVEVPWSGAHAAALLTRALGLQLYPRLDTEGYDVMLAETPYPGRVKSPTTLVIRYHDAVPMLMPHTIIDRAFHQASHYNALRRNVRDGAWFACVSEASRRDLVSIFPAAESRSLTIPNMVSHNYRAEDRPPTQIGDILRTRTSVAVTARAAPLRRFEQAAPSRPKVSATQCYLLCVNTLEPRKNHLTLLAAWERVRASGHPDVHLVLVGALGWESEATVQKLLPWVARGVVHVLEDVPALELRLLYRHARATICPSYAEGFGFSGVEAMCSGGVVLASDIPVHREVYSDAAGYFNPYSVEGLAQAIALLLDPEAAARRQALIVRGAEVSRRYLPEQVLPAWQRFMSSLARSR